MLLAGALGTVGRSALRYFEQLDDWDVVALSRRSPDFPSRGTWISGGYPQPFSLAKMMPANGAVWDRIVAKHGLKPYAYQQVVPSWQMADFLFGYGQRPNAHHISTIKIRKHGFHDCIDTEDLIVELLTEMQRKSVLPSYL